jgi:two-component system, chemotaxis family, sensor kinase CheA
MSKFGKYRGIIISVALFLLLDASVLVFNFYVSFQIAEDAVGVNLAGRQRMLSQRMAKSLYMLEATRDDKIFFERTLAELQLSQKLFDQTLNAFRQGGEVKGAGDALVNLKPVSTQKSKDSLRDAAAIWEPYNIAITQFVVAATTSENFEGELSKAIVMARTNNLLLLDLMNNLTIDLENYASSKATRLRTIQTLGIVLAILNFFLILFHFLRQLRESDMRIEQSRRETLEILETVNEGLFLIDRNLIIGEQHSAVLNSILGQVSLAGKSFQRVLENLISEKDAHTARGFIELLFDPRVKSRLIGDLNPLQAIEVNILQETGSFVTKHLRFDFARAYQGNEISHVLVTVVDVTEQVKLAKELSESRERNESQLEILTSLLHAHPILLKEFIDSSYKCYNRLNNLLRAPAKNTLQFSEKAISLFKEVHNFKGEASALKLDYFENAAHKMEDLIAVLRQKSNLDGNDFLPFTVQLESLIGYTQQVEQLAIKLSQFGGGLLQQAGEKSSKNITGSRLTDGWDNLSEFVQHVAQRQGKLVKLVTSGLSEIQLEPAYQQQLREICIQLLRNAVVHGIESPYDREMSEKPIQGRIDLRLAKISDTEMELTVMDDGYGLKYDEIRAKAAASGRWADSQIESWDNKQLLALLFNEGVSTADVLSLDAGRGVGMTAVMNHVIAHRGKITVSSRRGRYTRFIITMPLVLALEETKQSKKNDVKSNGS